MRGKMVVVLLVFVFSLSWFSSGIADSQPPKDTRKQTEAGKYVTASEAFELWKANPEAIKIIDCRTPQEYVFVGHAPMAFNIPSKIWTGGWNAEKTSYDLKDNPDFETYAKEKFKLSDTLMVMCRSGHRSAASVNRLVKAGFKNIYNIIDGFEGDKVPDDESYYKGKRMKNGWKNSTAPWTYDLDTALVYLPAGK